MPLVRPSVPRELNITVPRALLTSGGQIPLTSVPYIPDDGSKIIAVYGGVGGNVTISQDRLSFTFQASDSCYGSCSFSVVVRKPADGIAVSLVTVIPTAETPPVGGNPSVPVVDAPSAPTAAKAPQQSAATQASLSLAASTAMLSALAFVL